MADYVTNKELLETLLEYRKTKSNKTYNKLGKMFLEIATNHLYKPNFVNYSDDIKDNAISDACFFMCKYKDNFDENRSKYPNPFSYFSQIAKFAMIQNINKFHKKDDKELSLEFIDNFNENGVGRDEYDYKVDSQVFEEITKLIEGF